MTDKGITYNEMEALRDCPAISSYTGAHGVIKIYRRRIRDFFRKSYWFKCHFCGQEFRHYRP